MDKRNASFNYSPGLQMISDVDPQGVSMTQDGFYTLEYCRLVCAHHRDRYYQHLNAPRQQNFLNQENLDVVLGDDEEGSVDDLVSEDGVENYHDREENQIYDSDHQMYSVSEISSEDDIESFQVLWEDMDNAFMEIQSDLENDDNEFVNVYILVPEDGLQEDTILKNLKTRSYGEEEDHSGENSLCIVCQLEYEDNETLGILGCGHQYHSDCIKRWLMQKNVCPLCKETGIVL